MLPAAACLSPRTTPTQPAYMRSLRPLCPPPPTRPPHPIQRTPAGIGRSPVFIGPGWDNLNTIAPLMVQEIVGRGRCYLKEVSMHYYVRFSLNYIQEIKLEGITQHQRL